MAPTSVEPILPIASALPTMYDLPSENPEEPGLPDEFHGLQPQLLSRTLRLDGYSEQETFSVLDMNLYYDEAHTNWYKRPDWFLVVGVSRLYQGKSSRSSYVLWDEKVPPIVVIEFLSPGTESEDLGRFAKKAPIPEKGKPPCKFDVYEKIVKVPNYIVYNSETSALRYFRLVNGAYQEQAIAPQNPCLWIPELDIGLALWEEVFNAVPETWLRWCDRQGKFFQTDTEVEKTARIALENQLNKTIRAMLDRGFSIAEVSEITGLSEEAIAQSLS
jgi:Uma2 family endonuclease